MKNFISAIVFIGSLFLSTLHAQEIKTTNDVKLELEYHKEYEDKAHVLLLKLTNNSEHLIAFIFPNIWDFTIIGPKGTGKLFRPPPSVVLPLEPPDFSILMPRESFSKQYNISNSFLIKRESNAGRAAPRQYEVYFSYVFKKDSVSYEISNFVNRPKETIEKWKKLINEVYFVESIISNTVQFTIKDKK